MTINFNTYVASYIVGSVVDYILYIEMQLTTFMQTSVTN